MNSEAATIQDVNHVPSHPHAGLLSAIASLGDIVEVSPQRCNGAPVLKGTRFKVAQVFAQLAEGDNIAALAENFDIDERDVSRLLYAISEKLDRPAVE